jgi:hypothetical protein
VNIRDGDIIKLRKDIERVRKHEESRQAQAAPEEKAKPAPAPLPAEPVRPPSAPLAVRLRRVLEELLASSESSPESEEAIPEHVVTLRQVIGEEPKFEHWLLTIEALPPAIRNQQLEKMSFAFRVEDSSSTIAESFDRLQNPALFKAFCQSLRDARHTPA